jgi:hypothetical protein
MPKGTELIKKFRFYHFSYSKHYNKNPMDIENFKKTKRDQYGREYPIKITLIDGESIFGHIVVVTHSGEDFEISLFKQIENLDDWNANRIQLGTKRVSIAKRDIKDISVYKEY